MNTQRRLPLFVLAVSVVALATAYTAQYGFGLRPCVLCLTQRVPFAIAGLLAVLALLRPLSWQRLLMTLAGLAFLINAGIAVYHVGVEQKWWESACSGSDGAKVSMADLSALMRKPAEARCDEPAWEWHGVTMAGMNIAFSGGLALLVLSALGRKGRR
ncbi:disulfide bond formation protein B [Magnetospirillum sulfuroxidans]|uniref:Disulfide bond formation protein B n=1 Tax=Magnetospirillum sulfuroxidans TaxID=611300 RepID=A0ABS5ICV7_9PROT|nr:disulfide bond formation protein B [Magnetospirillum sulfuroxidans]MBR9972261.1 disulfide bond formation protein B [Magnetospirillum sulfuroxidans]